MHPSRFGSACSVVVLGLAVEGCVNPGPHPPNDIAGGTALSAPYEGQRPPIVLRPGAVSVNMTAPTRPGYTPGLASEVFWLSMTALMTFGAPVLMLPDVLERHRTDVSALPPKCADSWNKVIGGPQWLGPAEARHSALNALEDAVKQDLARRGLELPIEVEPAGAADPHGADALVEIGKRLSAPVLAVADVSFSIEPQQQECAMLMRVSAHVHLVSTNYPGAEMPPAFSVSLTRASPVSVMEWGANPEVGGRALRGLLGQLGQDIVNAHPSSRRK